MESTKLFKFIFCLFIGHKKVEGHFSIGNEYHDAQCKRCRAYFGSPKKELNILR